LIFAEVVNKFAEKLKDLEDEVGEVLKMETYEKQSLAQENQIKKAEKILKGEVPEKRNWFQNKIERELSRGWWASDVMDCDVRMCAYERLKISPSFYHRYHSLRNV